MASPLEQLYAPPDSKLPEEMVKALRELREGDELVQRLSAEVEKEKKALFEEMKDAKEEKDFPKRIQEIAEKNKRIIEVTNGQQKKAEGAYQFLSSTVFELDKKRAYFYEKIPQHQAMLKKQRLQALSKAASTNTPILKKAVDKNTPGAANVIVTDTVKTNEPIYCICKKVSFGRMIGCDNENCPIEWFHFPCVGLDESLPDPEEWYCANCRASKDKT